MCSHMFMGMLLGIVIQFVVSVLYRIVKGR